MLHAGRVLDVQLSARGLLIRIDVVFDGGRDSGGEPLIAKRGRGRAESDAGGPVWTRAADLEEAATEVASHARHALAVDVERFVVVLLPDPHARLPVLGDAVGAQIEVGLGPRGA